jgi:hypothetical protein
LRARQQGRLFRKKAKNVTAQLAGGTQRQAAARPAFLKKKQQKTFGRFDFGAAGDAQPRGSKFFGSFFFKKAPLSSTCLRFGRYFRATGAVAKKLLIVLAAALPGWGEP